MSKVKITKQELKKQKDSLARFQRYLPTLQLKKKQLQRQILKVNRQMGEINQKAESYRNQVLDWAGLFAQEGSLESLLKIKEIKVRGESVAGVDLPVFEKIEFQQEDYDFFKSPLWIDFGLAAVKKMSAYKAQLAVLEKQKEALRQELRIVNQRVNLFEKVKIPEAENNIKIIQIYLGERDTAAVVRGKIAKAKVQERKVKV